MVACVHLNISFAMSVILLALRMFYVLHGLATGAITVISEQKIASYIGDSCE